MLMRVPEQDAGISPGRSAVEGCLSAFQSCDNDCGFTMVLTNFRDGCEGWIA